MKFATKHNTETAIPIVQEIEKLLQKLQVSFSVGDDCEINVVHARQTIRKIEAALFERIRKNENRALRRGGNRHHP